MSPVFDPQLLDVLDQIAPGPLDVTVWRHMFDDFDPEQANTGGARWNPRGVDAIYASSDRETAVAEGDYRVSLEPLRPRAKRVVYRMHVRLAHVADLRNEAVLASLGLNVEDLAALDMSKTQSVGGAAEWLGRDGLQVPSVRGSGSNLVIFPNQMEPSGCLDRIDVEVIADPT